MAALSDSPPARIVDLRELRPGDLDPLLTEETQTWLDTLDWDFRASASLVRRFLEMQALHGAALIMNGYPVGYCYFVSEAPKMRLYCSNPWWTASSPRHSSSALNRN